MVSGELRRKDVLQKTSGQVRGTLVSDAKRRWSAAEYRWDTDATGAFILSRADGTGDAVRMSPVIALAASRVPVNP